MAVIFLAADFLATVRFLTPVLAVVFLLLAGFLFTEAFFLATVLLLGAAFFLAVIFLAADFLATVRFLTPAFFLATDFFRTTVFFATMEPPFQISRFDTR